MQHPESNKDGFPKLIHSQIPREAAIVGQPSEIEASCNFLDHYACNQDATSGLDAIFNRPKQQIKLLAPAQIDFVGQFLWNSPTTQHLPLQIQKLNQTLFFAQKIETVQIQQHSTIFSISQQQSNHLEQPPTLSIFAELSKDYRKNLAGYIMKKVIRMLLSVNFAPRLHQLCKRYSVNISEFRKYLQDSLPGLFGPNSIHELLKITDQEEAPMKKMLLGVVERTMRKRYTLQILKDGRMKDFDAYINVKNKGLLYFSQLLK